MKRIFLILLCFSFLYSCISSKYALQPGEDWPRYGGNWEGNRYSPLNQINTGNVSQLKVAWTYNTTDGGAPVRQMAIQCQPIVVDGVMYGTTGDLQLFALEAGAGKQIWKFDPKGRNARFNTSRGVVYWRDKDERRILYSVGSGLYAINADNGMLIKSFGKDGVVDLHQGLQEGIENNVNNLSVTASSPGVVFKNTFIVGSAVSEAGDAAPGYIRAFDVVTGKLKWVFHTIPRPGEFGYDSWPKDAWKEVGGVNSWSGIALDEKRGSIYFGTGSPASDFYGGNRAGANLFATSIMSLDALTGKMNWYYQTIHHDLWDRDHPTPPNLTTVEYNGKKTDVVVQATKDGLVYVLDRDKGTSLFPVEERAVPTQGLPGETPFPTQKFPLKPLPFTPQIFTENDITNLSPESHEFVRQQYLLFKTDNKFEPPSVKGTILYGYSGGAEWGGNSISPDGILYQNANIDPWVLQMIDTASRNQEMRSVSRGNALYLASCSACHGQDRRGSGTELPSLLNISQKFSSSEIDGIIKSGRGRMPSFAHISDQDRKEIINFLSSRGGGRPPQPPTERSGDAAIVKKDKDFGFNPVYINKVWKKLVDQNGYPGVKPPWGTLNAIDLKTGDYLWSVPLGEYPELAAKGIPATGTDSYGGPVSTAGGLVFISGTRDEKIRAFDRKTGKILWEYQLPAGGFATPISYQYKGKQYIVIAAGGARGQKAGNSYIAFTLK